MAFSNKDMKRPVPRKPHIQLIDGYYRVSAYPDKGKRFNGCRGRWEKAHGFATFLTENHLRNKQN